MAFGTVDELQAQETNAVVDLIYTAESDVVKPLASFSHMILTHRHVFSFTSARGSAAVRCSWLVFCVIVDVEIARK